MTTTPPAHAATSLAGGTTSAGDGTPPRSSDPTHDDGLAPRLAGSRPGRPPWARRVLAVVLDSAVIFAVVYLATGSTVSMPVLPTPPVDLLPTVTIGSFTLGFSGDERLPAGAMAWLGGTLLALILLQAYTGRTPGKRAAGIAVVDDTTGRPAGFARTLARPFAHLLDAILLVGYIRAGVHREGRTYADSLLRTVPTRTLAPPLHPAVRKLAAVRDQRWPWLRWPHRATGVAAIVLCAVSVLGFAIAGGASQVSEPPRISPCTVTMQPGGDGRGAAECLGTVPAR